MPIRSDIVVMLDGRVVEPDLPLVAVDDPMVLRGDGVFETLLLRDGRPCLLEAHLARLTRSAAIVGLPAPDLDRCRAAAGTAGALWTAGGEAVLRFVVGRSTAFVAVSELPAKVLAARREGTSAVTLDRGVSAVRGGDAGWSIAGVKSLSYAVNAAALRQAERLGVGNVVLMTGDGYVLEGPRSSVLIVDVDGVLVTPPDALPILPGTTVEAVFATARARSLACERRSLRISDLLAAQGVWLLSSVTLATWVHTLDGVVLSRATRAPDVAALVDDAIAGGE